MNTRSLNSEMTFTVITGASSGLGRALSLECAKRGMNLVLVALPGGPLLQLCRELEAQFGIHAVGFEADLTDRLSLHQVAQEILSGYRVNFLVNNAGTGGTHLYETSSVEYLDNIIQLNIRAVSVMTRLFLSELRSHPESWILNVSSMAAFSPIPYKTVYPASKAFVHSFSRGLAEELKGSRILVSVVHPGPILTNPDVIRRIIRQGAAGKVGLLQAEEIARIAVEGTLAGRPVIVPGALNKMNRILINLLPVNLRMRFLSKTIRREICDEVTLQAA